tara:strand:- start:953 stop:1099 length:147 start_codon:yes stop_codon:yes gene_type:complete
MNEQERAVLDQWMFMLKVLWNNPLVDKHSDNTDRIIYKKESLVRDVKM